MKARLEFFNGRIRTTIGFYPIVRLEGRVGLVVALKWKFVKGDEILVLESGGKVSHSRMTELEKLKGEVINSKQFICED